MHPNNADGMAKSVDLDQTAPFWSGSTLFAQTYLSKNLGSLWYVYLKSVEARALIFMEGRKGHTSVLLFYL